MLVVVIVFSICHTKKGQEGLYRTNWSTVWRKNFCNTVWQ